MLTCNYHVCHIICIHTYTFFNCRTMAQLGTNSPLSGLLAAQKLAGFPPVLSGCHFDACIASLDAGHTARHHELRLQTMVAG